MKTAKEVGTLCRVATARMPTKWGMFIAAGLRKKWTTRWASQTATAQVSQRTCAVEAHHPSRVGYAES
jgi:hypothetical protein